MNTAVAQQKGILPAQDLLKQADFAQILPALEQCQADAPVYLSREPAFFQTLARVREDIIHTEPEEQRTQELYAIVSQLPQTVTSQYQTLEGQDALTRAYISEQFHKDILNPSVLLETALRMHIHPGSLYAGFMLVTYGGSTFEIQYVRYQTQQGEVIERRICDDRLLQSGEITHQIEVLIDRQIAQHIKKREQFDGLSKAQQMRELTQESTVTPSIKRTSVSPQDTQQAYEVRKNWDEGKRALLHSVLEPLGRQLGSKKAKALAEVEFIMLRSIQRNKRSLNFASDEAFEHALLEQLLSSKKLGVTETLSRSEIETQPGKYIPVEIHFITASHGRLVGLFIDDTFTFGSLHLLGDEIRKLLHKGAYIPSSNQAARLIIEGGQHAKGELIHIADQLFPITQTQNLAS